MSEFIASQEVQLEFPKRSTWRLLPRRPDESGHPLPGVWLGGALQTPNQKLAAVRISENDECSHPGVDHKPLTDIDPVTASEVLSWLAKLTGTA